jgi:hypothetical protein
MAQQRGDGRQRISKETAAATEAAIARWARDGADDGELGAALRALGEEAVRTQLSAGELLEFLTDVSGTALNGHGSRAQLHELVAACIAAYYDASH